MVSPGQSERFVGADPKKRETPYFKEMVVMVLWLHKGCLREVRVLDGQAFPTVLIALEEGGIQSRFSRGLRERGYLVLEAKSSEQALAIVRTHSRPIHLLLLGLGPDTLTIASTLKQYRPSMKTLFVNADGDAAALERINPDVDMKAITELVSPPAAGR